LDRDAKFDDSVTILSAGDPIDTETNRHASVLAEWELPSVCIESCRRGFLDHIIALNERRLVRLLRDYINYYHRDKVYDSLGHDMPES
jgi:hypothetical protein